MTTQPLHKVLEATGYLDARGPVPGVSLEQDARRARTSSNFEPDATWCGRSSLKVYFKCQSSPPSEDDVAEWRQEIWNEGTVPLLWVISPDKIDIYNGFARPRGPGDAKSHRIRTFKHTKHDLKELDRAAGRLAMETDRFWQHSMARTVNRRTSVDRLLLRDIASMEKDLLNAGMARLDAQGLIGRSIFTQYLIDRKIVGKDFLEDIAGRPTLSQVLRDRAAAKCLFDWLRQVFNGDMFTGSRAEASHLNRVADFLEAVDPISGQRTLFPYQFEIIPVELISSIYEQFARSEEASHRDVHYTRLSLVSMVLDEVIQECSGDETVLDLTCGSGVFLVEALRRLVRQRCASGQQPTRKIIREVLYGQVFGADISEEAIQVAAFSLYLTALELDPQPEPPDDLTFKPLIGRTLFTGDIWKDLSDLDMRTGGRKFDVIVGNPPWSYSSTPALQARRAQTGIRGSRGTSLDFVHLAMEYASSRTRFGLVLGASHFFGRTPNTRRALHRLMTDLFPVTLVNLSNLSSWLFPNANMPGVVLLARHCSDKTPVITTVQVPWSRGGKRGHAFDMGPGDVTTLPLWDWERDPRFLRGACLGTHRDLTLMDDLWKRHRELRDQLGEMGTKCRTGLTMGNRSRDPGAMHGLPWLNSAVAMAPLCLPAELVPFRADGAERPRDRKTYRAPVMIVREFLLKQHAPRPLVAVAERDVVYSNAYFGVAFSREDSDLAHLLAGILSSSLATWFFLMTGSSLGLWKQRIISDDVEQMPVPALRNAATSETGKRIADLARSLRGRVATDQDWTMLDEAVFELYQLRPSERIVVRDGLFRATWQWRPGRSKSVAPASTDHVMQYAEAFVSAVDSWLRARNLRRMRAEVFDVAATDPIRVVRFVLEDRPGPSVARVVAPNGDLGKLLCKIDGHLGCPLADELVNRQEVRMYDTHEVVIVKPAARRHWMGVCGLRDADDVVSHSLRVPEAHDE